MNSKRIFTAIVCCAMGMLVANAQSIEWILSQIEANNRSLQASRENARAEKMQTRISNNLEDPSINYSPFFDKSVDGVASSEMVISQNFDFPTLYFTRNRTAALQREKISLWESAMRRDVLFEAKNICFELIYLNKVSSLLDQRRKISNQLLELFEKRLHEGDANIIEVNKIKMERMNVQTELAKNASARHSALQQLTAMNGNQPLSFDIMEYPDMEELKDYASLYDEVMSSDVKLREAEASVRVASRLVSTNRQQWLPKLVVGYRRNTSLHQANSGFLIGGSIPLFSNRRKVKIARAQETSAQLELEDLRIKAEANLKSKLNEIQQLTQTMAVYDWNLMQNTLSMLRQAVEMGRLSVIEYYVEVDNVYGNMLAYVNLQKQYHGLLAEVYKNRL